MHMQVPFLRHQVHHLLFNLLPEWNPVFMFEFSPLFRLVNTNGNLTIISLRLFNYGLLEHLLCRWRCMHMQHWIFWKHLQQLCRWLLWIQLHRFGLFFLIGLRNIFPEA